MVPAQSAGNIAWNQISLLQAQVVHAYFNRIDDQYYVVLNTVTTFLRNLLPHREGARTLADIFHTYGQWIWEQAKGRLGIALMEPDQFGDGQMFSWNVCHFCSETGGQITDPWHGRPVPQLQEAQGGSPRILDLEQEGLEGVKDEPQVNPARHPDP